MAGTKGHSGRKKIRGRTIQEYLDDLKDNELIEILDGLVVKAKLDIIAICPECNKQFTVPGGGDKDCAFYIANRIMGSPRQSIDSRSVTAVIPFTPDDYALIGQQSAREKTFLENYTPQLLTKPKKEVDNDKESSDMATNQMVREVNDVKRAEEEGVSEGVYEEQA